MSAVLGSGNILGGEESSLFAGYQDEVWYGVNAGQPQTANPVAADLAYQFPIWIEVATPVARIAMQVGTPVAGTLARLALYTSRRKALGAANLLVGSMTEYDMNAAVNASLELLLPGPLRLPCGLYWGVARFNGAAQPRTASVNNGAGTSALGFQAMLGSLNAVGVQGAAGTQQLGRVTAPLLYADAWPAVMPPPTIGAGAPGSPLFQWRRN
jgi:hypothetical protein